MPRSAPKTLSGQLSVLSARGRATSEGYLYRTLRVSGVNTVEYVLQRTIKCSLPYKQFLLQTSQRE